MTFVTLVIVTYGDRWRLLSPILAFAEANTTINEIVVVDNGTRISICDRVRRAGFNKVIIVRLENNLGSAQGFKTGIETALERGADYIWLLDDDNLPQSGSLDALLKVSDSLSTIYPLNDFALASFRYDHQGDIADGVPLDRFCPKPDSFLGFHLYDIPYKFWRRTLWGKPKPPELLPETLQIPTAPYSGFFFHRSLIQRIGTPNPAFVLYADDTEFTYRLSRSGGKIFLVTKSHINDLEESWNSKAKFASTFHGWLCGNGELRAYYGARNHTYIGLQTGRNTALRNVNKFIYIFMLIVLALINNRMSRLRLLLYAIRHGEAGLMGINIKFPLS